MIAYDQQPLQVQMPPLWARVAKTYRQTASEMPSVSATAVGYQSQKVSAARWRTVSGEMPGVPAVYVVMQGKEVIYVGKSKNFRARFQQHQRDGRFLSQEITVKIRECRRVGELSYREERLISRLAPRENLMGKITDTERTYPSWEVPKVTVRIPEEIGGAVQEYCRTHGVSIQEAFRTALRLLLRRSHHDHRATP